MLYDYEGLSDAMSSVSAGCAAVRAAGVARPPGARRRLADGLKFGQLDNELLVAPFDDVKQAAYYLPWALVRRDEPAGVAAQNAWLAFRERLLELDAVAVAATRYEADEDDVLLAISRLERALDDVILAVPERFRR